MRTTAAIVLTALAYTGGAALAHHHIWALVLAGTITGLCQIALLRTH